MIEVAQLCHDMMRHLMGRRAIGAWLLQELGRELYAGGWWVSIHDFFTDVPQALWYNEGNFDNGGDPPQARVGGARRQGGYNGQE